VCAWDVDDFVGTGTLSEVALASNLDAKHLRALQSCEALRVAVVSKEGHQIGVCAHVHVVRLNDLVIPLASPQKTTTKRKDRPVEVVFSRRGNQTARSIVHCLIDGGIAVYGALREVDVQLVVQICIGPGVVADRDLLLVHLARWEELLGVEGHPVALVHQCRPHKTRFGLARKEPDYAAFVC